MLTYKKVIDNAHISANTYFMYSRDIYPQGQYPLTKTISLLKDKIDMHQLVVNGTIPIENITYISSNLYKNDIAFAELKRVTSYDANTKPYVDLYYYLANIQIDEEIYNIDMVFYCIPIQYQVPTILKSSNSMCNIVNRHINLYNNFLASTNDDAYLAILDKFNKVISNLELYDLSSTISRCDPRSLGMITALYDYQIFNINWMSEREANPIYDILTGNKLMFFPNGLIYDHNLKGGCFVNLDDIPKIKIKGGIIADEPGIGKTLQMLTLCLLRKMPTAIVIPDHLFDSNHWDIEICTHFINPIELMSTIRLYSFTMFSELKMDDINTFKRIIIDEAHEIYSINQHEKDEAKKMKNKLFDKLTSTNCEYKWLITGTPFSGGSYSMFNIISLLTDDKHSESPVKFYYREFIRNRIYEPTLEKLFRRNIKDNVIKELHIPNINYNNVVLQFEQYEKEAYESEIAAHSDYGNIDVARPNSKLDIELLRKICSNAVFTCLGDNLSSGSVKITVDKLRNMYLSKFTYMYSEQVDILENYNKMVTYFIDIKEKIIAAIVKEEGRDKIDSILTKLNQNQNRENGDHIAARTAIHRGFKFTSAINMGAPSRDGPIGMNVDTLYFEINPEHINPQTLGEIEHNIMHYNTMIKNQLEIVDARKKVLTRYEKIIETIEITTTNDLEDDPMDATDIDYDKVCSICLCTVSKQVALYECGHFYCKVCSDRWRSTGRDDCVSCKKRTANDQITIISNTMDKSIYGTKLNYIIKLLKETDSTEQFVIFTQYDNFIKSLSSIMINEGIDNSIYSNWKDIVDFKSMRKKAIILSSTQQTSGLDLSFISNIIMIEPLNGEFSFRRDIEKQIIGRIHRIKQVKPINVYRLIISDTIEEQLYADL